MAKPSLYRARKTFWAGSERVRTGDLVVPGHPLLARYPEAFEPAVPRFEVPRLPKAAARSEAAVTRGETR